MHLHAVVFDYLIPQAQGVGDYAFFKLINAYFDHKIDKFGLGLMKRAMAWASHIALILTTLWITLVGYRVVTGQSREPMMGLVVSAARIAFVIGLATSMSFGGASLHRFFTVSMDREIHGIFTDSDESSADAIDKNLAYMQVAIGAIDAVKVPESSSELREQKTRALWFAGVGTASPPMVAGAMLLFYKFTLALFIGLGPIFILCLMFDQTKDLFRKWLLYGLGTLFSMSMLSVVVSMTMELMSRVAVALWVAKAMHIPGDVTEGLGTQAMQQGGIGLMMTTLIVTIPPAAAAFFQGTAGTFSYNTAFGSSSKDKSPVGGSAPGITTTHQTGGGNTPGNSQLPQYRPPNTSEKNSDEIKNADEVKRNR